MDAQSSKHDVGRHLVVSLSLNFITYIMQPRPRHWQLHLCCKIYWSAWPCLHP